jgi:hypothetical protein
MISATREVRMEVIVVGTSLMLCALTYALYRLCSNLQDKKP